MFIAGNLFFSSPYDSGNGVNIIRDYNGANADVYLYKDTYS